MERRDYDQSSNSNNYSSYNGNNGYNPYSNSYNNNSGSSNYNSYNDNGFNNSQNNYSSYNGNSNYNNNGYNPYGNNGYNNSGNYGSANGYQNQNQNSYNSFNNDDVYDARYKSNANYYESSYDSELVSSSVIARSFIVMLVSLLVTAFSATVVAASKSLFVSVMNSFMVFAVAELIVVFAAQFAMKAKNTILAGTLFFTYSVLNGITLSAIFYVYEIGSIQEVFIITALLFGMMAGIGAVTKRDLSAIGSIGIMLLLGVILITVANALFMHSAGVELMMDYAVVVIFVGLTAYDTQKMKAIAKTTTMSEVNIAALYCGMELYLDFINLFIRLLKLMGRSRK